ncbi:MAG: NAD(P)-dependent oxidoreductase [Spirochaetales bacterium]|nr:NAD(P)-dependent oxidoreductase [Spirochaetales bacterium]MCF7937941.1 NAD(P)-dependent oxidoreductase [Spirochaetales bacterium]
MENNTTTYFTEEIPPFTPQTAMEEASRCLLCLDAPCSRDCPANTNPGDFIRAIRFRNFKGAAEIIRTNNILGGTCGRVCPVERLCEEACSRTEIDVPIQIGRLQRFATDFEEATNFQVLEPAAKLDKEKVAMIGGGPASMACSAELAKMGYQVTIYDENKAPGGILAYGIVPSRLPQHVVDEEVKKIKDLGVEFVQNTKVGKDVSLDDLRAKGFKAFMLGTGLQKPISIDVPGTDLDGVTYALPYLHEARESKGNFDPGEYVVVIGGGDVAMDCASTAKMLGAKKVSVLYRRTRLEMPATHVEVAHCEKIGVQFNYTFNPAEIVGENGKVKAIKGSGSRDKSSIELQADRVVFAIGQQPEDLSGISKDLGISDERGFVIDKNYDGQTNLPDVFVAGDVVGGASKTVVHGVQAGKNAAESIDAYLTKQRGK